jgi:hypothetical protein
VRFREKRPQLGRSDLASTTAMLAPPTSAALTATSHRPRSRSSNRMVATQVDVTSPATTRKSRSGIPEAARGSEGIRGGPVDEDAEFVGHGLRSRSGWLGARETTMPRAIGHGASDCFQGLGGREAVYPVYSRDTPRVKRGAPGRTSRGNVPARSDSSIERARAIRGAAESGVRESGKSESQKARCPVRLFTGHRATWPDC